MRKGFARIYFQLTLPAIIAQLVVFIVDNLNVAILGTLSEKAISGFTIANQSFDIYVMLALGLSGGFHVYISQLYGNHDAMKYNQVLRLGLKIIACAGFLYSLCMCIFAKPFITLFIRDSERIAYGARYLRIYAWSHMLYGINLMLSGTYTIVGKARVAMYSGMINCICSLLCSYTLVYGKFGLPSLNVEGAALAVLIGRLAELVYLLVQLHGKDSDFTLFDPLPKLEGDILSRVLHTAGPLILNETCYALAFFMIVRNLSYLDERYISCYTVTNNCNKLFFAASYGLSPAVGALIGRNLGLGKFAEAKQGGNDILWMNFYIHLVFGSLLVLLSKWIPGFFSLSGDVAEVCQWMLVSKAVLGLFGGYSNVFYNILRIGGKTKYVFLLDGLFSLVCPMTVSLIVCVLHPLSFLWAYICIDAMNVIKTGLGFYLYHRNVWLNQLS